MSKEFICDKKEQLQIFALNSVKAIFKLEYSDVGQNQLDPNKIQIESFYIPENESITTLRKGIIELLINTFYNKHAKSQREEILNTIVDVPREIFANKGRSYNGKKEIETVLNFLLSLSKENTLELKGKIHIKDQLYWYKRWGIDKEHHEIIDEITVNLSTTDLEGVLIDLLHPKSEERIGNNWYDIFKGKATKVISHNTGDKLGFELNKIINQSDYPPPNFYSFLNLIAEDLHKTKSLIEALWEIDKSFIFDHCHDFLRQLRFYDDENNFYWTWIDKLKAENSSSSNNCILRIYNVFSISDILNKKQLDTINEDDCQLIISILDTGNQETYFQLVWSLPVLFYNNHDLAIRNIELFMDECNENHLNNLFIAFKPFNEKYSDEIRALVLNKTVRFNLPYNVELVLNKIIQEDGFEIILNYIEERFLYKRKQLKIDGSKVINYDFVPTYSGAALMKGFQDEQRVTIFQQVLEWFIELDLEPIETIYSTKIIELFRPSKALHKETFECYSRLIREHLTDFNRTINILRSLAKFENKNEHFINLIILILELMKDKYTEKEEFDKILAHCHIALTSVGVKSGISGKPFQVDLDLQNQLERILTTQSKMKPIIRDFFIKELRYVQSNIDRDTNEGGNEW